jgi:tartrate dehydratase beta subunit/fumarate hydratase class I family protein
LTAVGGAACLVTQAIRSAKILAFEELVIEMSDAFQVLDSEKLVSVAVNRD